MNRRYIASLAAAAALTLAVGLLVRQRFLQAEPRATAPPSEAAALQQLSQEGQLRRLSSFLSDRVADVAPLVEYVPAAAASGLRWRGADSVVTTLPDRPVVVIHATAHDTTRTAALAPPDSLRGGWALVVARGRSGEVLSVAGVIGGRMRARCGNRTVSQYVIGVPIPDPFAGAGIFDLSGRVIGLVVRCDTRLAAVAARELDSLIADPDSLGRRVRDGYGLRISPLDEATRRYFSEDSGLLVTGVRRNRPADRAGLAPGDVITAIDGTPVGSDTVLGMLASAPADTHTVTLRRRGATRTLTLSPAVTDPVTTSDTSGAGIELAPAPAALGIPIETVRPRSAASAAGLRAGDRLLRIDDVAVSDAARTQRLLDRRRLADRGSFIVFERDSVLSGVVLHR